MNFDLYEFLKYHNGSKFYPVKVEEIDELEKKLNLIVPKELKGFIIRDWIWIYQGIGE